MSETLFCPGCRAAIPRTDPTCEECRTLWPILMGGVNELDPGEPAAGVPARLCVPPDAQPPEIVIEQRLVIGRGAGVDLDLPARTVSRRHAILVQDALGWRVKDLDSRNGVYVNGTRVSERRLRDGDRLGIAFFEFVFRLGSDRLPPPLRGEAA